MGVTKIDGPSELAPLVHAALRSWYVTEGDDENLLGLLYLVQERRRDLKGSHPAASPTTLRLATNDVLLEGIEELETQDQTGARLLSQRFADDQTLLAVAHQLNLSESQVSRKQRSAIGRLTEILYSQEMAAREARVQAIEANLPPADYTRLFGFDEAGEQLLSHLVAVGGPWVVAVVGIGGIGKTSLTDATARRAIGQLIFEDVIWLRSESQTMSGRALMARQTYENLIAELAVKLGLGEAVGTGEAGQAQLRRRLKAQPYLVVIDNLETDAETAYLLNRLNDLAGPSKFLLTSRTRPAAQATVYHFSIGELSEADSAALLHHHARDLGIQALERASKADIQAIYGVTGGNPLALKLVVSLLDLLSLPQIVADLASSRPGPIEELYRHIYWQSWQILSQEAKSLLQAMPLVAESGGQPDYLQEISGLAADRFWPALQELRQRSLLEVRGSIHEKRYGIHRLTDTFLRTEIIHWEE